VGTVDDALDVDAYGGRTRDGHGTQAVAVGDGKRLALQLRALESASRPDLQAYMIGREAESPSEKSAQEHAHSDELITLVPVPDSSGALAFGCAQARRARATGLLVHDFQIDEPDRRIASLGLRMGLAEIFV